MVHGKQFRITPGRIPWKSVLLLQAFLCPLAGGMLYFAYYAAPGELFLLMCLPVAIAILGCFFLPMMRIRSERAKGDILVYDADRQIVTLPRDRMSIRKQQVVEFRILHDYGDDEEERGSQPKPHLNRGAAELRIVYRNPNVKTATLLRVSGAKPFDDVVAVLKKMDLARISLVEQQSNGKTWNVRDL
ncbi:MAG: hypothetical protein JWM68_3418 [Verrucomicrobiales bacterium]|nr:hypothetical protein [Verrucomicrobiales bacterium]